MPPDCIFNVSTNYDPPTPGQGTVIDAMEDTACQWLVKQMENVERKTWVAGILPPACPYDRDHVEDSEDAEAHLGPLNNGQMHKCDDMLRSLVRFADLDWDDGKALDHD